MSLYYSSLNKKMAAQNESRAYEQEAAERQLEAQRKLKLENKLKSINESILSKIIQKVDQQKSDDAQEEKIDFKNVLLESSIDELPFDNNIVTVESFRNALANENKFLQAVSKVAASMRVKNKFLTNKKFDPKKFITSLNVNGIRQGTINNLLYEAGFEIVKPPIEEAKPEPKRRGRQKKAKSEEEASE